MKLTTPQIEALANKLIKELENEFEEKITKEEPKKIIETERWLKNYEGDIMDILELIEKKKVNLERIEISKVIMEKYIGRTYKPIYERNNGFSSRFVESREELVKKMIALWRYEEKPKKSKEDIKNLIVLATIDAEDIDSIIEKVKEQIK